MSNSITLTASMRSNLLSLQNTQKLFDATQEKLATGKKVNSALDNPTAYFSAQSLTDRADDLSGLLDNMGQAVQSLQAADQSLTTLTTLVEQAESLVNSALSTTNTGSYIVGGSEVSAYDDMANIGNIAAGDEITFITGAADTLTSDITLTPDTVPTLSEAATFTLQDSQGNSIATATIAEPNTMTVEDIMTSIEDQMGYDEKGNNRVNVELNEGVLSISSTDKNNSLIPSGAGASELGFDTGTTITLAESEMVNSVTVTGDLTGTGDDTSTMEFTYNGTDFTIAAGAGSALDGTTGAAGVADAMEAAILAKTGETVEISGTGDASDSVFSVEDGTLSITSMTFPTASATAAQTEGVTVKSFMDQINSSVEGVSASINDSGKLVITSEDGADLLIQDVSGTAAQNLGIKGVATNGSETRANYASQFDDVLTQVNELIANDDSSYQGVNLLNGDDLTVNFNASRTSTLTVEGQVMNTQGLGLTTSANNWEDANSMQSSLSQVESALASIEEVSSGFAQNLSTIQTRQDFTENMVNILTTGADELTLADMNEEAANMLALQTRQQLATNALSLSSQSAQSVLSLF